MQYIPKPKRFEVATRSIPYILHSVYKEGETMFTYEVWKDIVVKEYRKNKLELFDIFVAIFLSVVTIPLDIITSPIEIISGIIYLILKNRRNK